MVVSAPLNGPGAEAPDYKGNTPLVYYRVGEWKRMTISEENTGVVHCIFITDWDGKGRDSILTASFTGIHLFQFGADGKWTRTQLAAGDPAPWPKSGSSDVAVGKLAANRFLAAIEPWHGNQVAIYRRQAGQWARKVIDDSLTDGHALAVADFDGDGFDEVIAGYRGAGGNVYRYIVSGVEGEKWTRETVDAGMAAASCAVADLNGDGTSGPCLHRQHPRSAGTKTKARERTKSPMGRAAEQTLYRAPRARSMARGARFQRAVSTFMSRCLRAR